MNFNFIENTLLNNLYLLCQKAESFALSDPETSALSSRRALEYIVKYIYQVNFDHVPKSTLFELVTHRKFVTLIDDEGIVAAIHYIRTVGNLAVHNEKISIKEAKKALENLHFLVGELAIKLGIVDNYSDFIDIIAEQPENIVPPSNKEYDFKQETQNQFKELEIRFGSGNKRSEHQTREEYINLYLREAGWEVSTIKGEVVVGAASTEIEVVDMPTSGGKGYVDYVLFGDDGLPLAIIEVKNTQTDPITGEMQAKLYAECIKKKYGVTPIIYCSNGYKTIIIDQIGYPSRSVYGFHTKDDLKLLKSRQNRNDIVDVTINNDITDRPYQKGAITNIIEWFNKKHRKSLLVLATGTGKTRVAISLVDILARNEWIKNILFLADRVNLIQQAKKWFSKKLPTFTTNIIPSNKSDYNARILFSTYQTMINFIDSETKTFSIGRFDLIIIDEAHRSIFNKYSAIFNYFDSLLLGLTATPREDIEKSTYTMFELDTNSPTYSYSLEEAVNEKYLVNFKAIEMTTDILKHGVEYDKLSDDEKQQYEETFMDDDGNLPDKISGEEFHSIITNDGTIDRVIQCLMNDGLKIEGNDKLGKSLIFAKDQKHALRIADRFRKLYPQYGDDFCKVVTSNIPYVNQIQENFDMRDKEPQIVVSVDMMDTGVDVADILNLVFFKRIYSKIKFWQMIGRGTRLSKNINVISPQRDYFDNKITNNQRVKHVDKQGFFIFDFCGVFKFFRIQPDGQKADNAVSLSQRIANTKLDIILALQKDKYQGNQDIALYYKGLKQELLSSIRSLNKNLINVRTQAKYIDKYADEQVWNYLEGVSIKELKKHVIPILPTLIDDEKVKAFDLKMLNIMLYKLTSNPGIVNLVLDVRKIAKLLLDKQNLPLVKNKVKIIEQVESPSFWTDNNILKIEQARIDLREFMKLLESEKVTFETDFDDHLITLNNDQSFPIESNFKDYREKVMDYLRENMDSPVIRKIRRLEQLVKEDLEELEDILWNKLGSKEDYNSMPNKKGNLAAFVRLNVGLEQEAVNEKLSEFLSEELYNSRQQEFIRAIIRYASENGEVSLSEIMDVRYKLTFKDWDEFFEADSQVITRLINALSDPIRFS